MSAYTDASLIMVPSGYKDGKLYSAKPTNGDGDFTFSRGSNLAATRVNSDGLIEKGRENLLLQSNQFDTTWGTGFSTLTSGQVGYDGTNDAWKIESTTIGGETRIRQSQTFTTGEVISLSVYMKKGNVNFGIVRTYAITGGGRAWFDLENGTVETENSGINGSIEDVGNGWYRCSIWGVITTTGAVDIAPAPADGDYLANAVGEFIYIQDSQLESGLVATPYIETGASTAQAGILEDMPRLDYSGGATCGHLLLEAQRSNILSHSEYLPIGMSFARSTFTNNDAISPEGLKNATKWQMTSDTGAHYLRKGFTTSDTYSVSIFAKKGNYRYLGLRSGSTLIGFDFDTETFVGGTGTKEAFGDGWWRLSVTATGSGFSYFGIHYSNSSGGEQTTADGTEYYHIYGMQIELGSYPTSYIPTYGSGSSVTRSADDAVATHTISDTETLTYYAEFIAPEQQSGGGEHLLENSSGSSRIRVYQNNSTTIRVRTDVPSVNFDYTYSSLGISVGDVVKICLRVDNGVMTAFINGVEKNTFAAATINFGRLHLRPQSIINVDSAIIFPTALTDAECEQLTTI